MRAVDRWCILLTQELYRHFADIVQKRLASLSGIFRQMPLCGLIDQFSGLG